VPLNSRGKLQVVLDDDKERIAAAQAAKDQIAISRHFAHQPSTKGYRFGNHGATLGMVRGPDVPFKNATASWRPPSADKNGPAAQRAAAHCSTGGIWTDSIKKKQVQSTPNLYTANDEARVDAGGSIVKSKLDVQEMMNPVSLELKRWQKFARFSETEIAKLPEMHHPEKEPEMAVPKMPDGELVNFPKYMLIHNCHLKQMDKIRYCREANAKRAAAVEAEMRRLEMGETADPMRDTQRSEAVSVYSQGMPSPTHSLVDHGAQSRQYPPPSWGAPKLRTQPGQHYAGNPLPNGRGSRTSNPYVTG